MERISEAVGWTGDVPAFLWQRGAGGECHTDPAGFLRGNEWRQSWGPLTEGSDGKFYGTTVGGGANTNYGPSQLTGIGYGTVFSVAQEGTLTCLASFQGTNGINPTAGVAEGNDGNFYGVTWYGGVSNFGTIFQVTPTGALTTLVSFTGTNGAWPRGGLIRGPDGAFYGSTRYGGASYNDPRAINFGSTPSGRGTLFKIATDGTFSLLYSFTPDTEGFQPFNKLVFGTDGNFYGTAGSGGTTGYGILFRMTQEAAVNTLTTFSLDTGIASIALSEGRDGDLYARSGMYDAGHPGAVLRIATNGTIRQLFHLPVNASAQPSSEVLEAVDGNVYGTTSATGGTNYGGIFRITPDGVLSMVAFFGKTNGYDPSFAALIQAKDGNLYGTTGAGGAYPGPFGQGYGAVYRLSIPSAAAPVLRLPIASANGMNLSWSSLPGRLYQVQSSTNIDQNNWKDLSGTITSTGKLVNIIDPSPADPQRFYRAAMLP